MKGLSLWQPWASLIFTGAKKFETRSWSTPYRGPVVIYAAKGGLPKYELKEYLHGALFKDHFQRGLAPLQGDNPNPKAVIGIADLPFGAALGVVDLVNCIRTDTMPLSQIGGDYPFGDFSPGRFAWQLENVRAFDNPISAKGAQGLFTVGGEDSIKFKKALPFIIGDKVRLLCDIWDDGEDHHPPGYLAYKGEVLVIRQLGGRHPARSQRLYISHENRTDASFGVYADEIKRV